MVCGFCYNYGTAGDHANNKIYNCLSTTQLKGYNCWGISYGYNYVGERIVNCFFTGIVEASSSGGDCGGAYVRGGSAYCCYCAYSVVGTIKFGATYLFYLGANAGAVTGIVRDPNNLGFTVTLGNSNITPATEEQLKDAEWMRALGFAI